MSEWRHGRQVSKSDLQSDLNIGFPSLMTSYTHVFKSLFFHTFSTSCLMMPVSRIRLWRSRLSPEHDIRNRWITVSEPSAFNKQTESKTVKEISFIIKKIITKKYTLSFLHPAFIFAWQYIEVEPSFRVLLLIIKIRTQYMRHTNYWAENAGKEVLPQINGKKMNLC